GDIRRLLSVLQRIVDNGDTVIIIEHNLDVIKTADYIIDLGPEGGDGGGEILTTGTHEELSNRSNSYTGNYLKVLIKSDQERMKEHDKQRMNEKLDKITK